MALTAAAVKQAQPKDKKYILKDDHGLYLEVSPSGGKWWRVRYWFQSRENRLSLGTYALEPEWGLRPDGKCDRFPCPAFKGSVILWHDIAPIVT